MAVQCTGARLYSVQVYCTGVCVQVTLYTEQGWQEDLPRLLAGREGHGCGHFRNEDGVLVDKRKHDNEDCTVYTILYLHYLLTPSGVPGHWRLL